MPRKPDLAQQIQNRVAANRRASAFVREDFLSLGGYDQVGRALGELVRNGALVRVGYGIYAKARRSTVTGKPVLTRPLISVATEGLRKLGYKVSPSTAAMDYREGRSTQIPASQALNLEGKRISRTIRFGRDKIAYETAQPVRRKAS